MIFPQALKEKNQKNTQKIFETTISRNKTTKLAESIDLKPKFRGFLKYRLLLFVFLA